MILLIILMKLFSLRSRYIPSMSRSFVTTSDKPRYMYTESYRKDSPYKKEEAPGPKKEDAPH